MADYLNGRGPATEVSHNANVGQRASNYDKELPSIPHDERIPSPDDVWIAVTGVTGAGKSSFISLLVDQDIDIGHGLDSATKSVNIFRSDTILKGRSVWLVDTPGFDDTKRSDTEILEEIATYFVKLFDRGIRFSGLLYLQRITDPRMSGTAVKNLELFKLISGQRACPIIRLVTTRWDEVSPGSVEHNACIEREHQLAENEKFFKPLLQGGAQILRQEHSTSASARSIIDSMLLREQKQALNIQEEMLNEHMTLGQTSAGAYLNREHAALSKRYEAEMEDIHESMAEALKERDQEALKLLQAEQEQCQSRRAQLQQSQRDMMANFRELDARKAQKLRSGSADGLIATECDLAEANGVDRHGTDLNGAHHTSDGKESRRHRFKHYMSAEWHKATSHDRRHSKKTALQEVQAWLWDIKVALSFGKH